MRYRDLEPGDIMVARNGVGNMWLVVSTEPGSLEWMDLETGAIVVTSSMGSQVHRSCVVLRGSTTLEGKGR